MSQDDADELAAAFKEACRKWNAPNTVDRFCDLLIATNRLTQWQCNKLKLGKWKGFYLDDYVLLEQSGKGPDFSSYKSRDIRDGRVVNIIVKPMNQTGGRIEYRVDPYGE